MPEASEIPRGRSAASLLKAAVGVLLLAYLALFVWNSLTRGRSYSPDSMNYIDVARNVTEGRGLVQSALGYNHPVFLGDGRLPAPFVAQPPLYPLAIAALAKLGVSEADGALWLPWLAYAATLGLGFLLARAVFGEGAGWFALAALVGLFPLRLSSRCAWSDVLGLAWILAMFLALMEARRGSRPLMWAAMAGACAGLAFATRYALLPFLLVGLAALWAGSRGGFRRAVKPVCAFAGAAALAVLPVLWHNLAATGRLRPPQPPSTMGWGAVAREALHSLATDYATWGEPTVRLQVAGVALLAVVLLMRRFGRGGWGGSGAGALLGGASLYLAFVISQRARVHFDDMGPRLLLPATVLFALCLAGWMARCMPSRRPVAAVVALLALVAQLAQEIRLHQRTPPVDMAARADASARVRWLRANSTPEDLILGNDLVDVAFYLRRPRLVSFSPFPYTEHPDEERLLRWLDALEPQPARTWVVLRHFGAYAEGWRPLFGPFAADLMEGKGQAHPRFREVARGPDTVVYRIEPAR